MRTTSLFFFVTLLLTSASAQRVGSQTLPPGGQLVLVDTVNLKDSDSTGHTLLAPRELRSTEEYSARPLPRRTFDKAKWEKIVGGERFDEAPRFSLNLSMPWASPLLKVLAYSLLIAAVIALVYMVVKNISLDLKIKRDELKTVDVEKPLENIDDVDVQALLEKAKREGNFKLAVRLYYLTLLKKLHELDKIAWQKDKTNRDYLSELLLKNFYFQDVRRLTRSYEAIWYGDHEVNADLFQRLSFQFELVFRQLNRTDGF